MRFRTGARARREPSRRRRLTAAIAVLAVGTSLLVALATQQAQSAAAAPPPNPTDGQISAAQARKAQLADTVGRLGAQVAQMQSRLQQLQVQVEIAEQRVAQALQRLSQAKLAAAQAKARVKFAQAEVVRAQRQFDDYVASVYTSGDVQGTTGALLTASDPNVLLQRGTLAKYQATHQLTAIGTLQRATVAKSNAEARARQAVDAQASAAQAAEKAKDDALAAVAAANAQKQQLEVSLAANQTRLSSAQLELATLNNQRKTFLAYVAEQRRLAEERARRLAAARAAAEAARQRQLNGGGGGPSSLPTPPPSGGSWSLSKGLVAVSRARHWLGMPYIWAGGSSSGPTSGGCTDPIAPCGVVGFDCSGLTLNAWAPYIGLDHFANTQYFQAGRFHPSPGQFQPGDLLFWGNPGAPGGLHHVAIYAGGGQVIQAPQSGDVVRYTPWNQVSWDYYGATRPLS